MATKSNSVTGILDYPGYYEGVDFSERNDQEFLDYAYEHLKKYEGFVGNIYLDTNGHVTIGIGHLIPNAEANAALPYEFRVLPMPPRPVTDQDKTDEWKKMKALFATIDKNNFPPGGSQFFRNKTCLDMREADAKNLFFNDVSMRLKELTNVFPNYNRYPDPARLGILDVYFNVGGGSRFAKFVEFKAAIIKQDWLRAKSESTRSLIGETRNNATYALFQEAYDIQKKKVPINSLEKTMQREEVKSILQAEKGYNDIW